VKVEQTAAECEYGLHWRGTLEFFVRVVIVEIEIEIFEPCDALVYAQLSLLFEIVC
jgi:hypothetical protein